MKAGRPLYIVSTFPWSTNNITTILNTDINPLYEIPPYQIRVVALIEAEIRMNDANSTKQLLSFIERRACQKHRLYRVCRPSFL